MSVAVVFGAGAGAETRTDSGVVAVVRNGPKRTLDFDH